MKNYLVKMFLVQCVFILSGLLELCNGQHIAKQKCNEYASAVYSQEQNPTMLLSAQKNTVSQCGIVEVPLIVGGVKAQLKEFPHLVIIGYGMTPNRIGGWHCGGSLISPNFVLTAAHCETSGSIGPAQKIKAGIINLNDNNVERDIVQRIIHPDFRGNAKYHDIALFRLISAIPFSPTVRPACLDTNPSIPEPKYVAAGFGKVNYNDLEGSKDLMKVQINAIPNQQCQSFYESDKATGLLASGITNSQICAGELHGGKDTCQGDSGGPLQTVLREPYCMYNVIGVVSTGKFCGFANSPALYSRVSYYVPWIEKIVWG